MGSTKQYLRYVPAGNCNILASPNCNVGFVTLDGQIGRFAAFGACENINIWDFKLGEKAQVLNGEKITVSYLRPSPNKRTIAVGYTDGSIFQYDLKSGDVTTIDKSDSEQRNDMPSFPGHQAEITTLAFDSYGLKLASGSKDTTIRIWDTVAERGLWRLNGHKGPITQVAFMSEQPVLISSSVDSFIKLWDLDTQHCFKTLVGHKSEIWGFALVRDDKYLVTGCGDAELRVWKITQRDPNGENKVPLDHLALNLEINNSEDMDDPTYPLQCYKVGSLLRNGKGRVVSLYSDESQHVVGCHGTDNQVELYYFYPDDEAMIRLKKRLKKERKKLQASGEEFENMEDNHSENVELSLRDEVKKMTIIKTSGKLKSFDLIYGDRGILRVAVVLANNTPELYTINVLQNTEPVCLSSIKNHGHHSEIRAVTFSSDALGFATGSADSVKLWNTASQVCLRTVKTGYILSLVFAPGDRHVIAGSKDGKLLIIDIAAGDVLEEIDAHTKEIWSVTTFRQADLGWCVTGSGDKTVKFWKFDRTSSKDDDNKSKVLTLVNVPQKDPLVLESEVLCLKVSPDKKYIAIALLNSTVKIHFLDVLMHNDKEMKIDIKTKFRLSLYGHSLSVLSVDISSDSTLIATGSADRNLKIWGMDFGDCRKSIFAHEGSVTNVHFVRNTHYLFSSGKDGKIKQWDCDSFVKITTLQGHFGESRALAVSHNGSHVVSCGSDWAIRFYDKTDQILVLQDEQEEEREEQEATLATGENTAVPGHSTLNLPSRKTVGSEKAADSILECLEICEKYKEMLMEHASMQAASTQSIPLPQPPPLMLALNVNTTNDFLLETFRRIRSSDLEEALLLLPFPSVCVVLQNLIALVIRGDQTELVCRLVVFLVRIHHSSIVANSSLLSALKQLRKCTKVKVQELVDLVGYNYYGMQSLQREIEDAEGIQLFKDQTIERKKGEKKRREREKLKRSVMVLNS